MSAIALRFCGADRPLRYTWGALAELREKFGTDFQSEISRAMIEHDLFAMAEIVAAGARGAGAEIAADDVMRDSPPIAAAIEAVSSAISYAYHGPRVKGLDRPLATALARIARALGGAAMYIRRRWSRISAL